MLGGSSIVIKVQCEDTLYNRTNKTCEELETYEVKWSFTNCSEGNLSSSMNVTYNYTETGIGNLTNIIIEPNAIDCEKGFILSPLKIESAYTKLI